MPPIWVAFPSSGKSRVDEGRPIAFKTRFFNFSHLGQTKKTAVRSNFTISVSCHHFVWAFPSSGKSRVDEGPPIEFKTRFFNFPFRAEAKKQPWDRILQFRFHATILGGLFQAAEKAGLTKVLQLRSKRVFQLSPLGRNEKTGLGSNFKIPVSCHHFGWAFPSSGKSQVDEGRPFAFKTRFFNFSHLGQTKKNSREIKFYNFGFMPPFCVGFSKQRKKPG